MTEKPAVLITGCSSGIGRATAERLLATGTWAVYATARNPQAIAGLADLGAHIRKLDTTDEWTMREVLEEIDGRLFGLVSNAGYGEYGVVEELPLDALRRGFETNVVGPVRLCQLALPGMRARGTGRIVFIGSIGGRFTMPGAGGYHLTKYALEALADALRFEVSEFGVAVTLLQPGLVRTEFGRTAVANLRRNGDPDGAYAGLTASVAAVMEDSFTNPELGVAPEVVAEAVERALTDLEPASREVVADDRQLLDLRAAMSDAEFDKVLRQIHGL